MVAKDKPVDKIFLGFLIALSVVGLFVFTSASLGIVTESVDNFQNVLAKQIILGVIGGWTALWLVSKTHYTKWNKFAPYIYGISVMIALLVFVPGIGMSAGGAKRWILIGPISFQPAELMKFGFVLFYASYLSGIKEKIKTLRYGVLPFLLILAVPVAILLKQPDTGTSLSIIAAGMAMFLVAGGRKRHFLLMILLGIMMVAGMAYAKPYVMERIKTFLDPSRDPLGAGYQLRQSLIAIGSGRFTGRGLGQSIQKFDFLPEAIGDSIFAVASEEFGFLGSSFIVLLFLFFALRGYKIAANTGDIFGRSLIVGIITLAISQSFINMGSMVGIVPLTGVPLIFLSHGGTALFVALSMMGIVLNISKYQNK